jgi:putative Ca2+/H+ antiporter (TMEM165/GDT1 family)
VEAFLVSTMGVGLAEMGDKTQILSMILTARFHGQCRSSSASFSQGLRQIIWR